LSFASRAASSKAIESPRNIVVVNDFSHINGGAAKIAVSSAVGLAQAGHRVTFVAAVPPSSPELNHYNITVVNSGQFEIAEDKNRMRAMTQGLWNVKAKRLIRDAICGLEVKDTIVHIHGWTKALSSSVIRECVDRKFKTICTLHDYFVACPNGGFYNHRKGTICSLKPMSLPCILENCDSRSFAQKQWRVARQLVQERLGRMPARIDAFIAVSKFSRQILTPFIPPESCIFDIENPISVIKTFSAEIGEGSRFLYVGRLSPEKGGRLVSRAAADLGCGLDIVGDGIERAELERIYPKAQFSGWLPADETLDQMRKARALIFPSLWYETQGLTVLEAAAVGIPSIVSDTSAARDLVEHGVTGLWFSGGNQASLISAMKQLQNTGNAQKMGAAAFQSFWTTPPTLERHIKELEAAYATVLNAPTTGPKKGLCQLSNERDSET